MGRGFRRQAETKELEFEKLLDSIHIKLQENKETAGGSRDQLRECVLYQHRQMLKTLSRKPPALPPKA